MLVLLLRQFFIVFLFFPVWQRNARVGAQGNWSTTPFNPPSMPLAVKSPYLNAWAPLGFGTTGSGALNRAWPRTWDASGILGWYAAILVDGEAYKLLGDSPIPNVTATQQSFVFTPTRSSYLLQAGPVNVNVTFLSPVEAEDIVRQSMPFSYLYFDVEATDGRTHNVRLYSDISGEWITGDTGLNSTWSINESSDFVHLQMQLVSPSPYQEINRRPQDATLYYCAEKGGLSWQIGPADSLRSLFANDTGLNNQAEVGTHPVDKPFTNLGIAVDLGKIRSTTTPVSYAVGVVRDPAVRYSNRLVQTEERSAYYWSRFTNIHDAIEDVIDHFPDAVSAAVSLDNKILGAAGQISGNYGDVLSLATRQAMGALEYTVLRNGDGSFNTSDVKAFMKNFGGIGSSGVNAVDVLYSAMPMYLYLNPAILGYLLSPLLEYQESTQYTNPYAAQNLGGLFPNATGNANEHDQKIEHSASMLIMSLAHAQASGDGSLLAQHYNLLDQWANYLVNNTMSPGDETTSSSDNIRLFNQTNLVLKGIIGIGAMSKISGFAKRTSDQSRYSDLANQYVQQWKNLASASGQLALNFGSGSSGVIYNLYADKLLQLNLVDSSVYDLQTSFYSQQTSLWKYGIPLDSSNTSSITRSDWMMFAASSASQNSVRDAMISQVWQYASVNQDNQPFPVSYHPDNGSWTEGPNSPAQGAMFAPLALSVPIKPVSMSGGGGGGDGSGGSSPKIGVIVGAAVGGVVGVGIIAGLLFFCYRRRRRQEQGVYTDRIQRVKPATFPSDSVLEPLSSTVHPGMDDMRLAPYSLHTNASTSFYPQGSSANISSQSAAMPFHVQNLADNDVEAESTVVTSSQSGSSRPMPTPPRPRSGKNGAHQDELRSEVDNLRREIERMKEERAELVEAPPSYDEGFTASLRGSSR